MASQVQGTAFITGAASGIGKATAHVLAKNGISAVALVDVNRALLEETKSELLSEHPRLRVAVHQVDVTDEASVEDAVRKTAEEFGQVDIGVNAAGIGGKPGPSHEMELSEWQRVIDINQTGVWMCQRALIRQMLKQEYVLPDVGLEERAKDAARLSMSHRCMGFGRLRPKLRLRLMWLRSMVRFDAKSYAREGIRINTICPGWVDTPMIHRSIESGTLDSQFAMIPLGRPAVADEIAHAILFLASPMSSYMCGEAMVVDGGLSA
ncbi:oxidoreductase, short-chain dehydrogenase/reductase family, putative [Aspergillus fumigatus A1163]|uniref:Oxidoreductase, short-chain dehydrogenase/reductase family, putative n=1 Tax=Aspergillus fumigatus (strain CBS 144.89 / FGSC A1163 / CEA10) TaxID=451804 RepID=B0Y2J7_ASPFC|nr:oxidoreductase, short-chain dehydrogenase/reductase family, putative [Aspergillus fumigatus A1163]